MCRPEERARYQEELQKRADELLRPAPTGTGRPRFSISSVSGAKGPVAFDDISSPRSAAGFRRLGRSEPAPCRGRALLHLPARADEGVPGRRPCCCGCSTTAACASSADQGRGRCISSRSIIRCATSRAIACSPIGGRSTTARSPPPPRAVVYRNFHRQFVAFNAAIAQYFRDLLIGEVIRGSQLINQRPFGSQATIQRLGTDLRWGLDRATYGNLYALTVETGNYLKVVLDMLETPDIKKAFDANTKWDVIEFVSERLSRRPGGDLAAHQAGRRRPAAARVRRRRAVLRRATSTCSRRRCSRSARWPRNGSRRTAWCRKAAASRRGIGPCAAIAGHGAGGRLRPWRRVRRWDPRASRVGAGSRRPAWSTRGSRCRGTDSCSVARLAREFPVWIPQELQRRAARHRAAISTTPEPPDPEPVLRPLRQARHGHRGGRHRRGAVAMGSAARGRRPRVAAALLRRRAGR